MPEIKRPSRVMHPEPWHCYLCHCFNARANIRCVQCGAEPPPSIQRAAFERWVEASGIFTDWSINQSTGEYLKPLVQHTWAAWQEADRRARCDVDDERHRVIQALRAEGAKIEGRNPFDMAADMLLGLRASDEKPALLGSDFNVAVQACMDEIGALTIPLGERYGGSALLLGMAMNVAHALRSADGGTRQTVLETIARQAAMGEQL